MGNVSGAPGTQVTVPVTLATNSTQPASVNFALIYDPAKIEFVSLQQGPIVNAAGKAIYYNLVSAGELRILIHGGISVLEDGLLADVTLAVGSTVPNQDTIGVAGDGTENAATPSATRIPASVLAGSVSVDVSVVYSLTTSLQGLGYVSLIPAGGQYEADAVVVAIAIPEVGWKFDHWEGDASGSSPLAQLVMDANKSVTAVFVRTFALTTAVQGSGSVEPEAGRYTYADETQVQVSATPDEGWIFDHWEGALAGSQNPATVVMDANKSVTAVFVEEPPMMYTLTTAVRGGGTIEPSAGAHSYEEGAQVNVSATPEEGHRFNHWEGALSGSQNPASLLMDADKTVTAVFLETPQEDVNGDFSLDAVDIQLVINGVLGLSGDHNCDVNGDGSVDAIDIQLVIN
ncbi:MAG: hypothetical protein GY851_06325, partial [bacterium]|nr:hypothetical protein [bacterium]